MDYKSQQFFLFCQYLFFSFISFLLLGDMLDINAQIGVVWEG